MNDDISPRKRVVLSAVISMHTADGEPVGSKSLLMGRFQLNVSSATLRNEMAQLTDIGLLEQPHVSAGRVPTMEGYKYYVHNLMHRTQLPDTEKALIRKTVMSFDADPDRAPHEAAKKLSELSGLVGLGTTPEGANVSIVHFTLMKVGRYNTAVIGVTSTGGVKSHICRTDREFTGGELQRIEEALNRTLIFTSYLDFNMDVAELIRMKLGEAGADARPIFEAAGRVISLASEAKVFVEGREKLLKFQELNAKDIFEFLADERSLRALIKRAGDSVTAFIGDEAGAQSCEPISILVGRYRCGNGMSGGIGLVGPLRINYEYVIPRLHYFCSMLSEQLIGA